MSEENSNSIDLMAEIRSATKYVCRVGDLDKRLNPELRQKFQNLFPDPSTSGSNMAWRMYYQGSTPSQFLSRLGIDFNNPTVRDAVAFDLVKLDDGSVSNDTPYTYPERINYSPAEYERFLLHRNFRINLVNLEPEWSDISYGGRKEKSEEANQFVPEPGWREDKSQKETVKSKIRTVDRMYQGARLSETLVEYFSKVLDSEHYGEVYVPFTNANDFTTEVSLIPNTHPDFRAVTSRAYYDMKYLQYRSLLKKHNISAISTFALVDPEKDKNHTGWYRVKVQRKVGSQYRYIVCDIDKDGQFRKDNDGLPIVNVFDSTKNTILCVCEDDFKSTRTVPASPGTWNPTEGNGGIRDIPMVKSTTSSHYSIFRQRVPEYDLKQVRHYLQFKNRLEGMELCLKNLKRDVHRKEVQASECFAKETMVLDRLFKEFSKNEELMELVSEYYDLLNEWGELVVKRRQLVQIKDDKTELLNSLVEEYRSIPNSMMDRKIDIGEKIKSIKLELNSSLMTSIKSIEDRMDEIYDHDNPSAATSELNKIKESMREIQARDSQTSTAIQDVFGSMHQIFSEDSAPTEGLGDDEPPKTSADVKNRLESKMQKIQERLKPESLKVDQSSMSELIQNETEKIQELEHGLLNSTDGSLAERSRGVFVRVDPWDSVEGPEDLDEIDTRRLHALVLQSERWRGFMLNLGYELNQLKKMETICEDATIKVRRLVHNFQEMIDRVEDEVWDENRQMRDDFSFTGISSSSLREIILLHDWHAVNASGQTAADMGFETDGDFMAFRKRCNTISYNLRKNQYAQALAVKKDRLQNTAVELRSKLEDADVLQYKDKYGWEAKKEQDASLEKPWDVSQVGKEQIERTFAFAEAERVLASMEQSDIDEEPELSNRKTFNIRIYSDTESSIDVHDEVNAPERRVSRLRTYAEEESRIEVQDDLTMPERNGSDLKVYSTAESQVEVSSDTETPERRVSDLGVYSRTESEMDVSEPVAVPGKSGSRIRVYAESTPDDDGSSGIEIPQRSVSDIRIYSEADQCAFNEARTEKQYRQDASRLVERTVAYLRGLGLVNSTADIETLVVRNRTVQYKGDVCGELNALQDSKFALDREIVMMERQRDSMKSILDSIAKAEHRILDLERENKSIFNACLYEKNRQKRNRLLIGKMENERQMIELKGIVKREKSGRAYDFSQLEKMRKSVDEKQAAYDQKVSQFKERIGLSKEAVDRLMVAIYNRYQDEILKMESK